MSHFLPDGTRNYGGVRCTLFNCLPDFSQLFENCTAISLPSPWLAPVIRQKLDFSKRVTMAEINEEINEEINHTLSFL